MFSIKNIFREKSGPVQEKRIEFFKNKFKKAQQKKIRAQERKLRLKQYIERAGFEITTSRLNKIFFNAAILINFAISGFLVYYFSVTYGITWGTIAASLVVLWVFVFVLLIIALWVVFYLAVDLKIFKRKVDIEEVLPDFLQLTASNINAGMTIDRALWFAVRPRFGVLAKEIENIAKDTMSGADLKFALEKFASKYDSNILKRAVSMINEGIEAGGKIGDLLNRVALDIRDQKSMVREMSANVTTYVIFIVFATVVAAPFLFAMSGVLMDVVGNISSALGGAGNAAISAGIPLTFSGTGISHSDFNIFAITSLMMTSFFSAIMTSTIKRGNAQSGMKFIPIYISISLSLYFVARVLAGRLISLFF